MDKTVKFSEVSDIEGEIGSDVHNKFMCICLLCGAAKLSLMRCYSKFSHETPLNLVSLEQV